MTYNAGDKVKYAKMRDAAEILSGPHASQGGVDRYLIKKADGNISLVKVTELSERDTRRDDLIEAVHKALYYRSTLTASEHSRSKTNRVVDAVLAVLGEDVKPPLAKGDRIRILKDGLEFAQVNAGDILTVQDPDHYRDGKVFTTNAPRASYRRDFWYFQLSGEGEGWERV